MTTKPAGIDISDQPELLALIARVLAAGEPRELRQGEKVLGVLTPAGTPRKHRGQASQEVTAEDVAAFEAAAGAWRDNIDVDRFLQENYAARAASVRPSVDL